MDFGAYKIPLYKMSLFNTAFCRGNEHDEAWQLPSDIFIPLALSSKRIP